MFSEEVESVLKEVCLEIAKRYEIIFIEIGVEKDHVHFLQEHLGKFLCQGVRGLRKSGKPLVRDIASKVIVLRRPAPCRA